MAVIIPQILKIKYASDACAPFCCALCARQVLINILHKMLRILLLRLLHLSPSSLVSPAAVKCLHKLKWDDNLAKLAQAWSNKCIFEHGDVDERFRTKAPDGRPYGTRTGQNLASMENYNILSCENQCIIGNMKLALSRS